jgi:hypothetical protein
LILGGLCLLGVVATLGDTGLRIRSLCRWVGRNDGSSSSFRFSLLSELLDDRIIDEALTTEDKSDTLRLGLLLSRAIGRILCS